MKKILLEIGLSEKESEVYLALLQTGSTTTDNIRQITKIERTNIYKILQKLEERNYVTSIMEDRKKMFQAKHPRFILQQLKQQEQDLLSELPKFEKILPPLPTTNINIFRGEKGLKALGNEILTTTKSYAVLGDQGLLQKVLPYYSHQFLKKIEKMEIKEQVIANKNTKVLKSKYSEIRYLDEINIPATTVILEKSIILVDWSEPCAIKIDNQNLANSYRTHFQKLWSIAKKS